MSSSTPSTAPRRSRTIRRATSRSELDDAAHAQGLAGFDVAGGEGMAASQDSGGKSTALSGAAGGRRGRGAAADSPEVDDSEDTCSICALGGELVVCDAPGCPRVYHATCLGRAEFPDKWLCPVHFCCMCGRADAAGAQALVTCSYCISSYCPAHRPGESVFAAARAAFQPPKFADDTFAKLNRVSAATEALSSVESPESALPSARGEVGRQNGGAKTSPEPPRKDEGTPASPATPAGATAPSGTDADASAKSRKRSRLTQELARLQQGFEGLNGGKTSASDAAEAGASNATGQNRKRPRATASAMNAGFWTGLRTAEDAAAENVGAVVKDASSGQTGPDAGFRCPHCLVAPPRVLFNRALQSVWSSVVNEGLPDASKALLAPVTDPACTVLYRSCGHPPAPVSGEGASSAAVPSGPRELLLRLLAHVDLKTAHAVLSTGTEEAGVPAPPACLGDVLAAIRAQRYTSTQELLQDLERMQGIIEAVTGSSRGALAASLPSIRKVTQQIEEGVHTSASAGAPLTRPTTLGVLAEFSADRIASEGLPGDNPDSLASEYDLYLQFARTVCGAFHKTVEHKRFRHKLKELESRLHSPVAPASGNDDDLSSLDCNSRVTAENLDVLLSQVGLDVTGALAKAFAARQSCLLPALSWVVEPYSNPRASLAEWCDSLQFAPVKAKPEAGKMLQERTQRALAATRPRILVGNGASSSRWGTYELTAPPIHFAVAASNPFEAGLFSKPESVGAHLRLLASDAQGGELGDAGDFDRAAALWAAQQVSEQAEPTQESEYANFAEFDATLQEMASSYSIPAAPTVDTRISPTRPVEVAAAGGLEPRRARASHAGAASGVPAPRGGVAGLNATMGTPMSAASLLQARLGAAALTPLATSGAAAGSSRSAGFDTPLGSTRLPQAVQAVAQPWNDVASSVAATLRDKRGRKPAAEGGRKPSSTTAASAAEKKKAAAAAGAATTAGDDASPDLLKILQLKVKHAAKRAAEGDAGKSGAHGDTLLLYGLLASQQGQLAAQQAQLASMTAALQAIQGYIAERAAASDSMDALPQASPIAPPDLQDGAYSSFAALAGTAELDAGQVRERLLAMDDSERDAVNVITEFADVDVDRGVSTLGQVLPASQAEVSHWMDDLSQHLRGSLLATAELKSAWIASRRGLMSFPAPVGIEQALLVPARETGLFDVTPATWADATPDATAAEGSSGTVVTLGEGRLALELALANANLRERVRALELQLAANGVGRAAAPVGEASATGTTRAATGMNGTSRSS